ncbi:bifunctional [glutamine synthetase] adenylyltransferase/[glutamine synthetase]-adenylyl-L-tyrosine phosphorylase [Schaalia sp. 19OD2882]|uniref:bifunctional [glutamine synthetase] adenylyltransferase/[glutamine synthetase]-adenylyl-L-tyrosine phosphorylase n=1 Tax=Schaalia sp. 19OD2882 TaxID=2794089 RepID=UPI001C1EAADC|nr:bifunctional [glutamine synthetase] adenylyltransferase/[glutamine synthetase]-adenylyl-L-tyrosine phosphorylase [Schaalia sp. 19OD2882]QWW20461.1 bifunctional [glutamine synthetase] adenylyltransferase/[glutamine synthetase]-adenylyl-L-tyrosine phosphorylase [Schaalia sp. 19OD2882]
MGPTRSDLRAAGLADAARAEADLATLPGDAHTWLGALAASADPDLALLQLTRLGEAAPTALHGVAEGDVEQLRVLVGVLGASRWFGDHVVADASRIPALWQARADLRAQMLSAVHADPSSPLPVAGPGTGADDLRRAYRRLMLAHVAEDLCSTDPVAHMTTIARAMSDLADAALEAGLALARREVDPQGRVRLAVIAMGKTGARELNYLSDVDVMHVVEAANPEVTSDREVVEVGTRLAAMTAQACSGAGSEQPLWTVDANLRPEGRNGALVRTLDSYRAYWEKWAQTWEFQALLKARHCAGDGDLGRRFEEAAVPHVWTAAGRPGFVEDTRAMRVRVEQSIARKEVERELKLGRGGLRDVEFTVQLLQLVHGRTDESLRVRDTVAAIGALGSGGYVSREDAAELTRCYCFLRAVEHRAQARRMRRTHLVPTDEAELRAMGRALGLGGAEGFTEELARVRTRVRSLHEDFFYRPIVATIASLTPGEAALDREAAKDRLAAIGYVDPEGALGHITALTKGTSRRAAIQRHLLPVIISWLADGADPDLGLLGFRAVSETIGESHWYLGLLRDSGVAAARLCSLLPNSRWVQSALCDLPEAVKWLDDDAHLEAVPLPRLRSEVAALVGRHPETASAIGRVRSVRSREVTRAALADALGGVSPWRPAICAANDVALEGALALAEREEASAHGRVRAHVALVAMGRHGGCESSYASDADVLSVHRPAHGVDEAEAAGAAIAIVNRVKSLLSGAGVGPALSVDMDLRPEGRSGAMSRTVESYREYYGRWASPWERQALLRARPAAGDPQVLEDFFAVVDPVRWGRAPSSEDLREIRLLKARMETERLPRGTEPARHVKLGPGGLTDVEWVVQLLQMQHAHEFPELRVTSTMEALDALVGCALVAFDHAEILRGAWELASRIRAGNVLASGRTSGVRLDVLPREGKDLVPLARLLGLPSGAQGVLEEDWLRQARRSREVMDELFWT